MLVVMLQLRPFLRVCQFVGMIPFRLEIDPETNEFLGFSFSFKYPITWWYILLTVLDLCSFCISAICSCSAKIFIEQGNAAFTSSASSLLIIISVLMLFTLLVNLFMGMGSRLIPLRHSMLMEILKHIGKVDDSLRIYNQRKDFVIPGIKRRVNFGIALSFIWAASTMWGRSGGVGSSFVLRLVQVYGWFVTISWIIVQTRMVFLIGCSFLLFHLCYYIVSYYVESLQSHQLSISSYGTNNGPAIMSDGNNAIALKSTNLLSEATSRTIVQNEEQILIHSLELQQNLFCKICQASEVLNKFYSLPVLFILGSKVVTASCNLYMFIKLLINPTIYLNDHITFTLVTFITDFTLAFIIFFSAEMHVVQAKKLRENVTNLCCAKFIKTSLKVDNDNNKLHSILISFLSVVSENRLQLSPFGFFHVGMDLVIPLTGAIITYLVILLQASL